MKRICQAVFIIVGSIIGAGFASGREISLFFAEFGYSSLLFIPIVFLLFYFCFLSLLKIGSKKKFQNINEVVGSNSKCICIVIITVFVIYSSAMFSGCVELLFNTFLIIPMFIFKVFIILISYFAVKHGISGLIKTNLILIPLIIVLLVIYASYSILNPITQLDYVISGLYGYVLPISIFMYVFSNIFLSSFILVQAGKDLKENQIKKISFISSLIICLVIVICIVCLITNGAVVMDANMPFIILSLRLGEPFVFIFVAMLLLSIITSLFSCLHTLNCSVKKIFPKKSLLVSCLLILVVSSFGFKTIVNFCYPFIGGMGFIVYCLIIKNNKNT